jgi:hypothetical protein
MKNISLLFLLLFSIETTSAQRNIVLIIADDLGSNWCGFQENSVDTVNMPNVRKLLSRGVRFSNAWANRLFADPCGNFDGALQFSDKRGQRGDKRHAIGHG